jgi:aldehyde dehydrogenase (NAD+)
MQVSPPAALSFREVFELQQAYAPEAARSSARERLRQIRQIMAFMEDHRREVEEAIAQELERSASETLMLELLPLRLEVSHTRRHLAAWMRPKRVPAPLVLTGTASHIRYEPKGNVLIITPWNYPLMLTLRPVVSALAAGNVLMIKPSEYSPHSSALIQKMAEALFEPRQLAVFQGDASVSQELLRLPFNHIHFTGSPAIGKLVMKAAAEHLSSVTLELGGKSPVIIGESADLRYAAASIAWGKCIKGGQSCVAPDYVLVHASQYEKLAAELEAALRARHEDPAHPASKVISTRQYERLQAVLEDALAKGARARFAGPSDPARLRMGFTLLSGLQPDMRVMQEEIFGPILPLIPYERKEEALEWTRQLGRPLNSYIFSRRADEVRYWMEQVQAGSTVVNEVIVHYGNPYLPFGGNHDSGIGKSFGFASFREFSHERGVTKNAWMDYRFVHPPYKSRWKQQLVELFYRLA